jgi:hypothetical protein
VNKKILISTPFPSLDDVAKELGISKSRQKKIEKLVKEIIASDLSARRVRIRKGQNGRHRDKDGVIDRKHGGTRVAALRERYGQDFGREVRGNAKLETLLERTGRASLSDYLRHRTA